MDKCPCARILCVHSNPIYLSQQPMLNCTVTSLTPIMSQWIKEVPTILVYFSIRLLGQLIYTDSVLTWEVLNRKVPLQFFMLGTSHFSVDNNKSILEIIIMHNSMARRPLLLVLLHALQW